MKRFAWLFFLALCFLGVEGLRGRERDLGKVTQAALALMEDIVPHPPFSGEMVRVSDKSGSAIWGPIFGDAQIGALVAVQPEANEEGSDADLCLLLWHDGWKFAQRVGKVSPDSSYRDEWDWGIRQRTPGSPCYVIDSFDLNSISHRKHFSWLCDPESHSLIPTGWPEDAIASVHGSTITFRRCEKSGYAPIVSEVHQFDGAPGKLIASFSGDLYNSPPLTIRLPEPATGKLVTWKILKTPPKYEPYHDRFSLGYSPNDKAAEPFHEGATVDVQWREGQYPTNAIGFLMWRLTGLEKPAQLGWWDEDLLREKKEGLQNLDIKKPEKVVVTGIPEAVKAFSWPPAPNGEKP